MHETEIFMSERLTYNISPQHLNPSCPDPGQREKINLNS